MSEHDTILSVLRHCVKEDCYGCPYRNTRGCTRKMAFAAKQSIEQLMKKVEELQAKDDPRG